MNENANKRTYFTPVVGEVYKNRNGWEYRCLEPVDVPGRRVRCLSGRYYRVGLVQGRIL